MTALQIVHCNINETLMCGDGLTTVEKSPFC